MESQQWVMTPMEHLPAEQRIASFAEVLLGYDASEVLAEADRCIQCLHPLCIQGCPNENPIPTFIGLVQEGRVLEAAVIDYENNALPSCTGRVCAWEKQCEGSCVLNARGEGVRIGAIERYIAEYALEHRQEFEALRTARRAAREAAPGRVAVVGAGPAGLTCADFLARRGVQVTVFEAQAQAGGLLRDGIPEFVLPTGTVEAEVRRLTDEGVRFRFETALGRDVSLEQLRNEYDAVFLGLGACTARGLGVPLEDSAGVWTAQAFLHQAKLALEPETGMAPPTIGERVLVVGAGNTAMDAARTALRLGATDVRIVYRRTQAESPSRSVEIEHALTEGVQFDYLVNPVAFVADARGHVRAAVLQRMRLGEPDASGRRRPEPVPGSEHESPCDAVILAVGYKVAAEMLRDLLVLNRDGTVRTVGEDGETGLGGVFAGGDAVRGPATVVEAVHDGRLAAEAIARHLLVHGAMSMAATA